MQSFLHRLTFFWRIVNSLEITQNHVHNLANFEQAIVIIISPLRFLRWIAKMHILADFLKAILCHSLPNSYIANIAIGGPVHGDSWQGIDSHDNTKANISFQFLFVYVCPLIEPCCWSSQLLSCITVCFFHNEIKKLVLRTAMRRNQQVLLR